ncbi:MBL fold metallo-hydrolase [Clostridium botulinum]|nr:MBL fold metallo-hydrolase [Clostridium botulinum]
MYYFSKNEDEENLAYEQHKKYVDKLFYNCIDGKSEKLYIKILEKPEITDSVNKDKLNEVYSPDVVHISLITNEMLEYDNKVFNTLQNVKSQLDISESINSEGMIIKLENNLESEGYLYRPYFLEFMVDINQLEKKDRSILSDENIVGKWIEASFLSSDNKVSEDMHIFQGVVLFSASPFKFVGKKLVIQDKNIKKIPKNINDWVRKMYDTSKSVKNINEIRRVLNINFARANDYKVKIYNVGDGNCLYIYCDNGSRILFDIGHNYNPFLIHDDKIRKAENSIKKMKPHTIILSHWDLDHVIGVVFAKQWIFKRPWIAPDLNVLPTSQVSMGALRVAKYLELYNQLYLVDSKYRNHLIYSKSNISIWCGKGNVKGRRLTETNNAGLIIEFNQGEILTLLPGDCEYLALPDNLNFSKKRFNHIVIPHHCSAMDTSVLSTKSVTNDYAIISVNQWNKIRPNQVHKDYLQNNCKYSIEETGGRFCIDIPSVAGININPCN